MIDGREKEGAELPFARIDLRQIVLTQQPRKEFLSQVLGVLGAVSSPADVSVEGIPVGAAECFERGSGLRRLRLARWVVVKSPETFAEGSTPSLGPFMTAS